MTCTDSITTLNIYLQSLIDANVDVCGNDFLMPTDITTYTTAIASTCTTPSSSITSPVSNRAYHLHNFDIPVHTLCEFLFRSDVTDTASILKSALWKTHFENTAITPPRIDTLSPTSPDEYYLLMAWVNLFQNYIETAKTVNTNDATMVEMAHQTLCDDEQYFKDQLDILRTDQCHEDALQDIVDDPNGCKDLYLENRRQHTRERMNAKKVGKRCRSTKPTMYVPLNRKAMQSYDHALVDSRFYQEQKEWQRKLDDNAVRKQRVEQTRLLGQSIGGILCQAHRTFHRLRQLIEAFLAEWQQCQQMCNTSEMPLMRRMTFQQQLKATIFDVRILMGQQQHAGNLALCEDRCGTTHSFCPFFQYSISSPCYAVSATTSASVVLDAIRTLTAYRIEQCVRNEMNTSTLQAGAVVTKHATRSIINQLVKWKYMLLVFDVA